MRNSLRDAEGGLPVRLEFVVAELKTPVRTSVLFRHAALFSVLMDDRLDLLPCCNSNIIKEQIHSRFVHIPVHTHHIAAGAVLHKQSLLKQIVSRKMYPVLFAPISYILRICLFKQIGEKLMIYIADRLVACSFFPEQFGKPPKKRERISVFSLLLYFRCPGQKLIRSVKGILKICQKNHVRLVRKNRRHHLSELFPQT